jgi:hypothetical protein
MKVKIEDQEQFERTINEFTNTKWDEFLFMKKNAINLDSFHIEIRNAFNRRMNFLQDEYPLNSALVFIENWKYKNNSKQNLKMEFDILALFCKEANQNIQEIAIAQAELKAIQKVFTRVFHKTENPKVIREIENFSEISKVAGDKQNSFCKEMPLKIAKDHFKIFTEKKSKNQKSFLTIEQFEIFIERAFRGKVTLPKQKFNQKHGDKLLIQAVFYDFYNNNCFKYFSTMQCQDKFILLLTDNFEGWDFGQVKANFTPKSIRRL